MKQFSNAKVGDKVWDIRFGWGEITEIRKKDGYPITVEFYDDDNVIVDIYTLDGKCTADSDKNPILFWNKFEIPNEAYKKASPALEIDTPLWVRKKGNTRWYKRYFAGWTKDGLVICWNNGATSSSVNTKTDFIVWDEWKPFELEEE